MRPARPSGAKSDYAWVVLSALQATGGVLDSPGGRVTGVLAKATGVEALAVGRTLRLLERDGAVLRDVRGRGTYRVEVVDLPDWYRDRQAAEAGPPGRPQDVEVVEAVEVDPMAVPDARLVADELLRAVLDLMSGDHQAAVDAERFAETVAENTRLRRKLHTAHDDYRTAADRVDALVRERDGLRVRVRTLESNLQAAAGDTRRVVDAEVERRIATFMAERPAPARAD